MESRLERMDKKENSKYSAMNKISHQHQMKFNLELMDSFIEIEEELERVFEGKVLEVLVKLVAKGKEKIKRRCKAIAMADRSEHGWVTVEEFFVGQVAEDEKDSMRIEEAERRAEKKAKKKEEAVARV